MTGLTLAGLKLRHTLIMSKQQNSANEHRRAQRQSQDYAHRAREVAVDIQWRQAQREVSFARIALAFLKAEADTGLTLARIAADSGNAQTRARNRVHAREAYDNLVKYRGTAADAGTQALVVLDGKIAKLREQLQSLGEAL